MVNKLAVTALVVIGLVASLQAQDMKEKTKEPVKKVLSTAKPAIAPAPKAVKTDTSAPGAMAIEKAKTGQPSAAPTVTAHTAKKVMHHRMKKSEKPQGTGK